MTDIPDCISLVPGPTEDWLNPQQLTSYREHRRDLIQWMLTLGKEPAKAAGYAEATADTRARRLDKFYRWVWAEEGRYTETITIDHADAWMEHLAHRDYSASYKACCQKSVKTLFKWQSWKQDEEIEWDPIINYTENSGTDQPRDFLTRNERKRMREAVLEYGAIPHYNALSPEERDEWKAYLAQRFGEAKETITRSDWDRANSFKFPSMVWTAMDAGLRPVEVERATVGWVDLDNGLLRIPKEDSSKNADNWTVSLRDRTVTFLGKWLDERAMRDRYEGRDALWLTNQGNPYDCHSLRHVMDRLCDLADIDNENRDVTWYSIRHSVGTYMAREEGLAAAQAQLRHKSERTTMKYDQAPVEDRKAALERMG